MGKKPNIPDCKLSTFAQPSWFGEYISQVLLEIRMAMRSSVSVVVVVVMVVVSFVNSGTGK